jgi:hypothetical protein
MQHTSTACHSAGQHKPTSNGPHRTQLVIKQNILKPILTHTAVCCRREDTLGPTPLQQQIGSKQHTYMRHIIVVRGTANGMVLLCGDHAQLPS